MSTHSKTEALQPDGPDFFDRVQAHLRDRPVDRNILLNIPIWGWTGDGKTCALLTAIHYADPAEHAIGFALVDDVDDVARLEAEVEPYRGLSLAAVAETSRARLRVLGEKFIDAAEWPPGTDEPTHYLVRLRIRTGTVGYAIFPDLKGGSFRELDDAARGVLGQAHACIILVNPELYVSLGTGGKRYRDEIAGRLEKCEHAKIPTCIMITKADQNAEVGSAVDQAQKRLTILAAGYGSLVAHVARISVVGMGNPLVDQNLPPAEQRNPIELLRAWIWIVDRALATSADKIREVVPQLHAGRAVDRPTRTPAKPIPELRRIGEYSDSPGQVVSSFTATPGESAFLFLGADGALTQVCFSLKERNRTKKDMAGTVAAREELPSDLQCHYISGEVLLGPRRNANAVWQGPKGGALAKLPLPFEVLSWSPIASKGIAALDKQARLHFLSIEAGKWVQTDYLADLLPPTPHLVCRAQDAGNQVIAVNGTATAGVLSNRVDGRWGERFDPGIAIRFDTEMAIINGTGLVAAQTAAGRVMASDSPQMHDLGAADPNHGHAPAVAASRNVIASLQSDRRLIASVIRGESVTSTSAENSPILPAAPDGICLSPDGRLVIVTYADATWEVFEPFGLGL